MKYAILSAPRSGSTLLYNMILDMCAAMDQEKPKPAIHYNIKFEYNKYILMVRDFRDCVLSDWRVKVGRFDSPEMAKKTGFIEIVPFIREIKASLADLYVLKEVVDKKNFHVVRFRDLIQNKFDTMSSVFAFLEIPFAEDILNETIECNSIERVKNFSRKYKDFTQFDKKTHWHGHHVYKGKIGTWKELLEERDHGKLTRVFKGDLVNWGFEL